MRRILVDNLTSSGYDCIAAASASQALLVAERIRPHLAVIDVRLPGEMEGVLLAAQFRSRETTARMPLLLMSGHSVSDVAEKISIAAIGRVPVIPKSLGMPAFLALIEQRFTSPGRGKIVTDEAKREVWIHGKKLDIPGRLFDIFIALLDSPAPMTRETLHEMFWPDSENPSTVDEAVSRLRRLLAKFSDIHIVGKSKAFALGVEDEE